MKSYLQVLQTGLRLIYNVSVGVIYNRPIQGHWTGLDILYKISQYPMLYKGEVLYTGLKDWTSVYLQFFIEILCTKGWISVFPPFLCISRQNGSSGDGAVFVIVISVGPKWNYVIFTFWFVKCQYGPICTALSSQSNVQNNVQNVRIKQKEFEVKTWHVFEMDLAWTGAILIPSPEFCRRPAVSRLSHYCSKICYKSK